MRKILIIASALLFSVASQAQNFHIENANDSSDVLSNGDVVEVGELGDLITKKGFFDFKIRNNSEETIKVQAKLVEIENGDPIALEFCFAVDCYTGIVLDQVYPTDDQYAEIEAGQTHIDTNTDHIVNFFEPENGEPVEYTFKFFEINDDLEEIGEPFYITYKYNPSLSTPDYEANFAALNSTILNDSMRINLEEEANLSMYDMSGRKVFDQNLTSGSHQINLPNLSSNMYFVQVSNKEGATQTFKVIVK